MTTLCLVVGSIALQVRSKKSLIFSILPHIFHFTEHND
uniref:Uncharacterized protein n=1 Tax=Rhizophora mucronata TaxID=61149 RepID=A0A2P2J6G4_RHIMU